MCLEWITTHCTHLGSRRETEAGSTTRNMEKNSGKGDQGQRVKVMGRGGDSSEGQNNLEGESVRPNSPHGGTWKLMMMNQTKPLSLKSKPTRKNRHASGLSENGSKNVPRKQTAADSCCNVAKTSNQKHLAVVTLV